MIWSGIWEKVYNPNFNYGEFATIRNQSGLIYSDEADMLNVALFGVTAKQWRIQQMKILEDIENKTPLIEKTEEI